MVGAEPGEGLFFVELHPPERERAVVRGELKGGERRHRQDAEDAENNKIISQMAPDLGGLSVRHRRHRSSHVPSHQGASTMVNVTRPR